MRPKLLTSPVTCRFISSIVRRVLLRQPLFEFRFFICKPRVIGDVLPLKWIGFDVVKFFATVTVVDVMKLTRTHRVARTEPMWRVCNDGRVGPVGSWVMNQWGKTASVELFILR